MKDIKETVRQFNKEFLAMDGKPMEDSLPLTHNNIRDFLTKTLQSRDKEFKEMIEKTFEGCRDENWDTYCRSPDKFYEKLISQLPKE